MCANDVTVSKSETTMTLLSARVRVVAAFYMNYEKKTEFFSWLTSLRTTLLLATSFAEVQLQICCEGC